jgi:CRISPR-associated protein Cmr1
VRLLWDPRKEWPHKIRYTARAPFWPRAGFGLPIQIKFKTPPDEPPTCELRWCDSKGDVYDRLASPLIVKPMAMADGSFVPIALWLYRAYPEGGQVGIHSNDRIEERTRAPFNALYTEGKPLFEWLHEGGSIREAFWEWLRGTDRARELQP